MFGGCQRACALVLTTWGQQVTVILVIRGYNGFCTGGPTGTETLKARSPLPSMICAHGYLSQETAFVVVAIEPTPIGGFSGSGWDEEQLWHSRDHQAGALEESWEPG